MPSTDTRELARALEKAAFCAYRPSELADVVAPIDPEILRTAATVLRSPAERGEGPTVWLVEAPHSRPWLAYSQADADDYASKDALTVTPLYDHPAPAERGEGEPGFAAALSAESMRCHIAEQIGVLPDELDEDISLLAITGEVYRAGTARMGPLEFCLTEHDGAVGVWADGAFEGRCLGSGHTATEALRNALRRLASPPAPVEGTREEIAREVWLAISYPSATDNPTLRKIWNGLPDMDNRVCAAYAAADRIRALPVQGEREEREPASPEEFWAIDRLVRYWEVENSGGDEEALRSARVVREFLARQIGIASPAPSASEEPHG